MSITEKFKLLPAPLWILEMEKSTISFLIDPWKNTMIKARFTLELTDFKLFKMRN